MIVAGALAAVSAVVMAAVWFTRGPQPDAVAEDYLRAIWHHDAEHACELATDPWRHVLYNGRPYADCDAYASAARTTPDGFAAFEPDTDIVVSTELINQGDDRARVSYVVELTYHGGDRAGFDALWQGGGATDRGTIELVDRDGQWRINGVAAG